MTVLAENHNLLRSMWLKTRDYFLTGVGLLLIATPHALESTEPPDTSEPGSIGNHFARVGDYLRSAISNEAPQLLGRFSAAEKNQLELPLKN